MPFGNPETYSHALARHLHGVHVVSGNPYILHDPASVVVLLRLPQDWKSVCDLLFKPDCFTTDFTDALHFALHTICETLQSLRL